MAKFWVALLVIVVAVLGAPGSESQTLLASGYLVGIGHAESGGGGE